MCTTVIRIFPSIEAIPRSTPSDLHNPEGVSISNFANTMSSVDSICCLGQTFATAMPDWVRSSLFDPNMEKHRLTAHMYQQPDDVRMMRSMENLYLVDFIELTLKDTDAFETALTNLLKTMLADYMQKYVMLIPGDWPAQFFMRKIIYKRLKNSSDPLLTLVPILGALHVSLNAIEDVFLTFQSFFQEMYSNIFVNHKPLRGEPKPWRIFMTLEVIYGGWTKIQDTVLTVFKDCKDVRYTTLINLLDNYIPLVLSIYGIIFRTNNFKQYFNAMIRVWTMFYCFRFHHYNKAPLVWPSNVLYWTQKFPQIFQIFQSYVTVTDESGVENTHSIIQSKTKSYDSVTELIKKVKTIFQDETNLQNFQSNFMPPKNYTFSHKNIDTLKGKAANILVDKFKEINTLMEKDDENGSMTNLEKL